MRNIAVMMALSYPWIGTVPGTVYMTDSLTRFGYVTLTAKEDNLL